MPCNGSCIFFAIVECEVHETNSHIICESNLEPKVDASNPSKESLIANIEYHVDRSKKIVRGLSGKNIAAEPENIELCEKHNERIEKLENLLLQMRVDNNVRTQNLYDLYDEYNVIMGNVPN